MYTATVIWDGQIQIIDVAASEEFQRLKQWTFDVDYQHWDKQLERDVSEGKLDALAAEALAIPPYIKINQQAINLRDFITYPTFAISLTVGLSALEGLRKQIIGKVTIATVFPNISKNSTLYPVSNPSTSCRWEIHNFLQI